MYMSMSFLSTHCLNCFENNSAYNISYIRISASSFCPSLSHNANMARVFRTYNYKSFADKNYFCSIHCSVKFVYYKSSCMQHILPQHERILNTIYYIHCTSDSSQICGTHKFMNSFQVDQVAKGNKYRVQNVKYVSIINSDVTEPSAQFDGVNHNALDLEHMLVNRCIQTGRVAP